MWAPAGLITWISGESVMPTRCLCALELSLETSVSWNLLMLSLQRGPGCLTQDWRDELSLRLPGEEVLASTF